MPSGKDLLAQFKAASWKSPEELEAFVEFVEAPAAADLLKLLEALTGKAPAANVSRARLQVFARLIDKNPDKTLFVPLPKALKVAEPTLRAALAGPIPNVTSHVTHD